MANLCISGGPLQAASASGFHRTDTQVWTQADRIASSFKMSRVDAASAVLYRICMMRLPPRPETVRPSRHSGDRRFRQSVLRQTAISPFTIQLCAHSALFSLVATAVAGTLGAAAFVALAGLLFMATPQRSVQDLLRYWPLLLLPVLAMLSTIWSESPERSMRAGLQLLLTFAAAILICRRLSATALILSLLAGYTFVCLLIVPDIPFAVERRLPLFSALLGSKNQVAFAAHILIALSLAVAADRMQPAFARLFSPLTFALGGLILVLAQSAGAMTSLAITMITFPVFVLFGRFNISLRIIMLLVALICAGVALLFLPDLITAWNDFRVTVLKKDATLTGRTYLWDVASRLSAEHPWLGRGYYAFWRQGNIDAEGLWRWGGIANRSGFNFHNAYIEMQVDLGWVGLTLLVAMTGIVVALTIARLIVKPSTAIAFFLSYLLIIHLRGFAESVLIAPFSLMSLLLIAAAIYSTEGVTFAQSSSATPNGSAGYNSNPSWSTLRSSKRIQRRV